MTDRPVPPLACNLAAMDAAQRARYQSLVRELDTARLEVRELADGYALRFESDPAHYRALEEFITLEHLCCPFLTLTMEIAADDGPLWLRLTGREGVKEFLRLEFELQAT